MEHSKNTYLIYDNYSDLDAGAAKPLIEEMISHEPENRPKTDKIHKHQYIRSLKPLIA